MAEEKDGFNNEGEFLSPGEEDLSPDEGADIVGHRATVAPVAIEEQKQLWLISYADFMTVLMIFFLVMYGYSFQAKVTRAKLLKNVKPDQFNAIIHQMESRLGDQLTVQQDKDKTTIRLGEKILFPSGSAVLTRESLSTIEELANSVKLVNGAVIIGGHTDNVPITGGRFKSNFELSAARAFSVINALSDRGVNPDRLSAWGFGEYRPLKENDSKEHRAMNRRIEVVIFKNKTKVG